MAEERDFRKEELLGKFTAKMLYRWNNRKFKEEYLRKLERNWNKQKNDKREREEKVENKYENKYLKDLEGLVQT